MSPSSNVRKAGMRHPWMNFSDVALRSAQRRLARLLKFEDGFWKRTTQPIYVVLAFELAAILIALTWTPQFDRAIERMIALLIVLGVIGGTFYAGKIVKKFKKNNADAAHYEEIVLQNKRFKAALNHLPVGLSMFDAEHRLIACNSVYREIYGVPEELSQAGAAFEDLMLHYVKKEGLDQDRDALEMVGEWTKEHFSNLTHGKPFSDVQTLSNGQVISLKVGPTSEGGWVDVLEDITEQRRQEAQIEHMAHHDALTGLPNRVQLRDRLKRAIEGTRSGDTTAVVHFLDLDRFKAINDTLGHPSGDALLKLVAERLGKCVRATDFVARFGGDEFVVLQISKSPLDEVPALAARLIEVISVPYRLDEHQAAVGVSIGIAVAPKTGANAESLLMQADLALYRSKENGRGIYTFFEEEMNTRAHERRELEQDLRSALSKGEFEVNYQPIVSLESNEICGLEALLRWRHPTRGVISPVEFIPLAEETGLIGDIGEWVLRQACTEAVRWPVHVKMAVNLSPVQFKNKNLVALVSDAIREAGIKPQRLELEITESVLLHDSESTIHALRQIQGLGVRIAMDDFGTGYSSLSYLRQFPFDKIKIDRSFVGNLTSGEGNSLAIVRAISDLGRALGLTITAEGVETLHQREMVRLEGCTEMQGYLFSAAQPPEDLRRLYLPPASDLPPSLEEIAA
jgi:diguanylate cyclase (GGDEF)-like protein